jgi:hypothetical protein
MLDEANKTELARSRSFAQQLLVEGVQCVRGFFGCVLLVAWFCFRCVFLVAWFYVYVILFSLRDLFSVRGFFSDA